MKLTDRQKATLKLLSDNNVHYNRLSDREWVVWTSGYKSVDHTNIEKFMLANGFRSTKESFDKQCGKTAMHYKTKEGN